MTAFVFTCAFKVNWLFGALISCYRPCKICFLARYVYIIIMPKLFIDACTEAIQACRGAHVWGRDIDI